MLLIRLRSLIPAFSTQYKGGLEEYLLKTPAKLLGDAGLGMRIQVREALAAKGELPHQIRERGSSTGVEVNKADELPAVASSTPELIVGSDKASLLSLPGPPAIKQHERSV